MRHAIPSWRYGLTCFKYMIRISEQNPSKSPAAKDELTPVVWSCGSGQTDLLDQSGTCWLGCITWNRLRCHVFWGGREIKFDYSTINMFTTLFNQNHICLTWLLYKNYSTIEINMTVSMVDDFLDIEHVSGSRPSVAGQLISMPSAGIDPYLLRCLDWWLLYHIVSTSTGL